MRTLMIIGWAVMMMFYTGCNGELNVDDRQLTVITTSEQAAVGTSVPAPADVDIDNQWALMLVNSLNPLPEGFQPQLTLIGSYIGNERNLDSRAAPYALKMIEAAGNDGISFEIVSAFRFISTQETNFKAEFNNFLNHGYSRERAFELTAEQIAVPRASEHNAGLAIDFNNIIAMPNESFDQTPQFEWLQDNAHKFGFIMRYPKDTIDITGITYEPWHWRFVGVYHAGQIRESGLTLEEYIGECAGDDSVLEAWRAQII
jgi:D-alanyl-D-alanine carboxypeptidase